MKVLMIARKTMLTSPGGDTVQILSTAKYLRLLNVQVDVVLAGAVINFEGYNLVHFFNIIRPDDILPYLSKSNLPFVVSTIFVDYNEYEKKNRTGILKVISNIFSNDQLEYLKSLARFVKNGDKLNSAYYVLHGHRASVKYIAKKAAMLLPNSDSEYQRFVKQYHVKCAYRKIPNAIDSNTFADNIKPNEAFKNHVLCVGRIEGRKNQLLLIRALLDTDLKLTIIGKPSPNHIAYYQECAALAGQSKNIQIIAHASHDELSAIYRAAKVHVLPSWFETTGLSSLEAAIMDCNIVVTRKGDTEEYFSDMAYYCDPEDMLSIRSAVLDAYHNDVDPRLKQIIKKKYTWENTAFETLEAYQQVLSK